VRRFVSRTENVRLRKRQETRAGRSFVLLAYS
jgi:hypothetical protein